MNISTYQKQWRLSAVGFRIIRTGPEAYEVRFRHRWTGRYELAGSGNDLPALVDFVWGKWWESLWRTRVLTAPSHVQYEYMLDQAQRDAFKHLAERDLR